MKYKYSQIAFDQFTFQIPSSSLIIINSQWGLYFSLQFPPHQKLALSTSQFFKAKARVILESFFFTDFLPPNHQLTLFNYILNPSLFSVSIAISQSFYIDYCIRP